MALPKIPKGLATHLTLLVPLALTTLLQRFEFVLDNRFIGYFGKDALEIQTVQNVFFSFGQALGFATATSALIFWKSAGKSHQRSTLKIHMLLSIATGLIASFAFIPFLGMLVRAFQISTDLTDISKIYLGIGLGAIPLQAAYVTINAILIGNDKRVRSTLLILGILTLKTISGLAFITLFHDPRFSTIRYLAVPMRAFAISNLLVMLLMLTFAIRYAVQILPPESKSTLKNWTAVWGHELWFSLVRAYSPLILSLLIASVADGFVLTFQMTANIAYIFCLPIIAGNQIGLRDAAEEQQKYGVSQLLPLSVSVWWPFYFYSSFLLTQMGLLIGAIFGPWIIELFYGYSVPHSQRSFIFSYFIACMIGQCGHLYVIRLRSFRESKIVSRNLLVSEIITQITSIYLLVHFDLATPLTVGTVGVGSYCVVYLVLNFYSCWKRSGASNVVRQLAY
jgi:hypothetical protein